jgi:hypothetical protein
MWSILLVPPFSSLRPLAIVVWQAGGATPARNRAAASHRLYWPLLEPFEPLEPEVLPEPEPPDPEVPPDVVPPVVPPAEPLVAAPPPLEVVE